MHYEEAKKLREEHEQRQAAIPAQPAIGAASSFSYDVGGRVFGGSKWAGGLNNSGQDLIADHHELRRNTRNAMFDSVQAKAIHSRVVDTEIASGLVFDSSPVASILGITEQKAERKGNEINQRFAMWCNSLQSTLSETHNFYQWQHLAGVYGDRDNDFLAEIKYSAKRDLISPVQVKLIDPDQLIGSSFTYTDGLNNPTHDGIERDANGKEIAYWLSVANKDFTVEQKRISAIGARSGRRQMLHYYQPEYSDQGRGFSRYAHILQNLESGTNFELSHIMKAIGQSQHPIFVEPSKDEDAKSPLGAFTSQRSGTATLDVTSVPSGGDDAVVQFIPMPEATMDIPGAANIFNARKGSTIKPGPQNAPIDTYPDFMKSYFGYVGASVGMPLQVALMQFDASFSASRGTLLLYWNLVKMHRANYVAQLLHPIYTTWFSEEIAAGRFSAPGFSDPRLRAAWLAGRWNGTPLPNIDPMVTAKSNELNLKIGATDMDEVARSTNESDGKSNRAKLARQVKEYTMLPWEKKQTEAPDGEPD